MRPNRLVLAAAAGLATCLVPAPIALAQNQQPVPALNQTPASEPELVNIDFAGGTLGEFVKAMRQAAAPAQVNVILRGGAEAIGVPAVSLRNVTISSALDAICPSDQASINSVQKSGAPIHVIEGRRRLPPSPDVGGEFVRPYQGVYTDAAASVPSILRIYSVRDILSGDIQLSAIMDAAKTALGVQREQPQPELLFHEDSGVLIVRGTDAQHGIVSELLKTLERDAERARVTAEHEASVSFATQERLRAMQAEIEQNQLEVERKRAQLAHLQEASQQGLASNDELLQATFELRQTESRSRHLQAELEAMRKQSEASTNWRTGVDSSDAAPPVEGSSRFTARHPKQVRELVEALVAVTSVNPQSRILGFEMQDGRIVVRYAGSKKGVEHLAHVCKLIELLDQGD
ncbi:MAG: hypothetical protein KJZ65_11175 [Phycisphaerales bacterium]|nr:hypothetical protein [Phycisphaerales bacterium]